MPCEKPGIASIDEGCCFSCFTVNRGAYNAPIAIVLHEVDEHIEALNNRMENCCYNDHNDCHMSFHYGIGVDGRILEFVIPDNTAWSFDPLNTDQDCGTCGWSIATQEGAGVDPNLYTVNVAISTGIVAASHHGFHQNHYNEQQYNALVRLAGWLAETYGIAVNQNTIWRHCDELDDFPDFCPDGQTYSDFLTDIQACIDSTPGQSILCDELEDFVDAGDATPSTCGNADGTLLVGQDCDVYSIPYIWRPCDLTPVALDIAETFLMIQTDPSGCCNVVTVPIPACDNNPIVSVIGLDVAGDLTWGPSASDGMMTSRITAVGTVTNETDRLIYVDGTSGPVTVTLTDPTGWCHNQIRVKRIDTSGNAVSVASAALIDGVASILLATPGPFSAQAGEAVHLQWDGATWFII